AKEVRMLGQHRQVVRSLALSPNGKILASLGDHVVHLWEVGTGKEIRFADGHEGNVVAIGLSNDGKTAASVTHDGAICKWDAATGERLGAIDPDHFVLLTGSIATLSADARIAAVCPEGVSTVPLKEPSPGIQLWDVVEGKELTSPKMGRMQGAPAF